MSYPLLTYRIEIDARRPSCLKSLQMMKLVTTLQLRPKNSSYNNNVKSCTKKDTTGIFTKEGLLQKLSNYSDKTIYSATSPKINRLR